MAHGHVHNEVYRRPRRHVVALGLTVAAGLTAATGAAELQLAIGNFVGGGGSSSAGDLTLIGTIGDPAAGMASSGTLVFAGGVVAGGQSAVVFSDSFESGSLANWTSSQGGGSP